MKPAKRAVSGLPDTLDGCDQHRLARSALARFAGAATQAGRSDESRTGSEDRRFQRESQDGLSEEP